MRGINNKKNIKKSKNDPVDLSIFRRKKINARKRVIKSRNNLSPKKKEDTFNAYSKYLKSVSDNISTIQSIIKKIKDLTDNFSKLDE